MTELILRKKDLGEYLIDNDQELGGPLSLVRMTNFYGNNFGIRDLSSFQNVFRDIGTYHKQNADSDVIEKLSQYYLVSLYKPSKEGAAGPGIKGSINYRLGEYVDAILKNSIRMNNRIQVIIDHLKKGLSHPINIHIAVDTSINKGIIIDANKRAIAQYYLKHKASSTFEKLLNSNYRITIVYMKSGVCRIIYPLDFLSLCSETLRSNLQR